MIKIKLLLILSCLSFILKGCENVLSQPRVSVGNFSLYEPFMYNFSVHNQTLAGSLVSYLIISLLLVYYLNKKHKKEKLLEVYSTETRLSKKMHDEIANEIYTTINYISDVDYVSGYDKKKILNKLTEIYTITRDLSKETGSIDTGENYVLQLKHLLGEYCSAQINIISKGIDTINWNVVDEPKKIATYRVLQEIMVNMKKHSEATLAFIDFSVLKNKITIKYSDNGKGSKIENETIKNGLQNVENRIDAIGGIVTFETNAGKGFHITFLFPA